MRIPLILLAFSGVAAGQDVWTPRYSGLPGYYATCAAGRPGLYMVCGNYLSVSQAKKSADGITWTSSALPEAFYLMAEGAVIIGAGNGGIWTTSDGSSFQWRFQPSGLDFSPSGLASGNGRLIATTGDGRILAAATPAGPWVPQLSIADRISGVAFGAGIFLASTSSGVIKSTDGTTWSVVSNELRGAIVGYHGGKFFTAGQYFSEDRGDSWEFQPITVPINAALIKTGAAGFVCPSGNSLIYSSADFSNWTSVSSGLSAPIACLANCGDLWIASSEGGIISTSPPAANTPAVIEAPDIAVSPAMQMEWASTPGRTYQIQGSSNNLQWEDVGLPLSGTGNALKYHTPANAPRRFYRIVVR